MSKSAVQLMTAITIAGYLAAPAGATAAGMHPAFADPTRGKDGAAAISDLVLVPSEAPVLVAGSRTRMNATFTNPGLENVTVKSFEVTGSPTVEIVDVTNSCEGKPVQPATSCVVALDVEARAASDWRIEFTIEHDGQARVSRAVIDGKARDQKEIPKAKPWPDQIPGYGILISDRVEIAMKEAVPGSTVSVPLINAGDKPLVITDLRVMGDSPFEVEPDDGAAACRVDRSLEPNAACALVVRVKKGLPGQRDGTIAIVHSGLRGLLLMPVSVDLSAGETGRGAGSGVPALLPVSPGAAAGMPLGSVPSPAKSKSAAEAEARRNTGIEPDEFRVTGMQGVRAIVRFPDGISRILRQGQSVKIAGSSYTVEIAPAGVTLTGSGRPVLLVFDAAFSSGPGLEAAKAGKGAN